MKIIDIHVHVGPLENKTASLEYYNNYIPSIINYMHDNEIYRCILLCDCYKDNTKEHCAILKNISQLYRNNFNWMCSLNDNCKLDDMYNILLDYKEKGACGIGEIMAHKYIDSDYCNQLFQNAEQLNLPILFHLSPCEYLGYGLIDDPGLPRLENALSKYKKLRFIGHSQPFWHEISANTSILPDERNTFGRGKIYPGGRLLYLLDNYHNLYCDLSANSGSSAIMRDEKFGIWFIKKYQDRLLFGSDINGTGNEYPLLNWLKNHVISNSISMEVFEKICYYNAEKMFL